MSLQYLSGTGTTCLVFEGGDIVTVQGDDTASGSAHIEILGSIDAGIAAARWSPDEELLAVVTKERNVIFMGNTFDPLAEVAMTEEDLKASKHVSVGWGKKETQFEGRGAKALRDPTIPLKVDEGVLSPHEDGITTVSWRGDGAFVAINSVEGNRRVIRVYSREGELDSASEPVDGLEGGLSWRPAGNLIAGIQRFPESERIDVVFFERNGLRHGEFTLRSSEASLASQRKIRLEWNSDSTVLAIVLDDVVQLWTMGNYHWYLKEEIAMDSHNVCLAWHPEKALRYAVATSKSVVLAEDIFCTARGTCRPPHDHGAVAVIDGNTVKITPFRVANVPPPMSLFEVTTDSSVIDIAFGRQSSNFAVLHHRGVDVYQWPSKSGRLIKPQLSCKVPFEMVKGPGSYKYLRICYSSEDHLRVFSFRDGQGDVQFDIAAKEESINILEDHRDVLACTASYEDEACFEAYGQGGSGKPFKLDATADQLVPAQFPMLLPWFEITKTDGAMTAFGLSRNGHLYGNSRVLAKNCTSFLVTPSHLIFTTSNHFVKFVHLTYDVQGKLRDSDITSRLVISDES